MSPNPSRGRGTRIGANQRAGMHSHSARMRRRSWRRRGPRSASLARPASPARRTPMAGLLMVQSMWTAQAERGGGLLLGAAFY